MPKGCASFPFMQKSQEQPETEYLVSAEVMDLLKISRRTLERWVADEILPAVKIGGFGARRYKRTDVLALLRGESIPKSTPVDSAPPAEPAGVSSRPAA